MNGTTEDLWLVYHVPKTGGQTLRNYLREQLGPEGHVHFGRWEPEDELPDSSMIARLPQAQRDQIRASTGHRVTREVATMFPGRQVRELLVLRRPVDRIVSGYHFRNSRRVRRGADPLSFTEFIEWLGPNSMTKWVARFFGEDREQHALDRSLYELNRVTVVWPLEDLDDIVEDWLATLGISGMPPRANRLGHEITPSVAPTEEELRRVWEENLEDEVLYRACVNRKDKSMANLQMLNDAGTGR